MGDCAAPNEGACSVYRKYREGAEHEDIKSTHRTCQRNPTRTRGDPSRRGRTPPCAGEHGYARNRISGLCFAKPPRPSRRAAGSLDQSLRGPGSYTAHHTGFHAGPPGYEDRLIGPPPCCVSPGEPPPGRVKSTRWERYQMPVRAISVDRPATGRAPIAR